MGTDNLHQPVGRLLRHPLCPAADETAQLGPHHQHRFGARVGRFDPEGWLCRRQARPRRDDEGGGARNGGDGRDLQRHLPGLGAHAAGAKADRRAGREQGLEHRAKPRANSSAKSSLRRLSSRRLSLAGLPSSCAPRTPPTCAAQRSPWTAAGSPSESVGDAWSPIRVEIRSASRRPRRARRVSSFNRGQLP